MNIFLSLSSVLSKVRGDVSNQAFAPETTSLNDGVEDAILEQATPVCSHTHYLRLFSVGVVLLLFTWRKGLHGCFE